ncbi:hypothetical protein Tco_0111201 [Tanacetum coccineum]
MTGVNGERTMLDFFLVQYAHLWQHLDNLVHLFSVGKLKADHSLAGSAVRGYIARSPMLEAFVRGSTSVPEIHQVEIKRSSVNLLYLQGADRMSCTNIPPPGKG